ncbi:hypothetical protein SEVIR_6G224400v4 [Setaria viridis]|uniref:Uncharacterized protein n=1 Tax=Setaria viridis TaxID=4556 RepID=A0A4U6U6I2_SETVI|nr:uncharacterized protein LOC117861410 [Setaria viridis]TKW11300.1 hypothetical protein SEVIR_6G224400v2 [Setaria viridis]
MAPVARPRPPALTLLDPVRRRSPAGSCLMAPALLGPACQRSPIRSSPLAPLLRPVRRPCSSRGIPWPCGVVEVLHMPKGLASSQVICIGFCQFASELAAAAVLHPKDSAMWLLFLLDGARCGCSSSWISWSLLLVPMMLWPLVELQPRPGLSPAATRRHHTTIAEAKAQAGEHGTTSRRGAWLQRMSGDDALHLVVLDDDIRAAMAAQWAAARCSAMTEGRRWPISRG